MFKTPIRASDEIVIPFRLMDVWQVLSDIPRYPQWWPKSLRIQVVSNGKDLVGSEVMIRPVYGRAFRCGVEAVEIPKLIRMRYSGFVDGCGEWTLEQLDQGTRVTYKIEAVARGWLVASLGMMIDLGRLHSRSMHAVLSNLRDCVAASQQLTIGG